MNPSTSQILSITLEIWRFWNMVENVEVIVVAKSVVFHWKYSNHAKRCEFQESIVVATIEYNLGNMKNCEKQSNRPKIRHSKKAYNSNRFWRKIDVDASWQKLGTPRMLMKCVVFEGFWWSQGSKSDGALSHFESRRDYSNILRPQRWGTKLAHYVIVGFAAATARFWKVPNRQSQRHRSLAEDYDVLTARPNQVIPSN